VIAFEATLFIKPPALPGVMLIIEKKSYLADNRKSPSKSGIKLGERRQGCWQRECRWAMQYQQGQRLRGNRRVDGLAGNQARGKGNLWE
jgi:hypothetical protein